MIGVEEKEMNTVLPSQNLQTSLSIVKTRVKTDKENHDSEQSQSTYYVPGIVLSPFISMGSSHFLQLPYRGGTTIISILKRKELKQERVKQKVAGPNASQWPNGNSNPGILSPELIHLSFM